MPRPPATTTRAAVSSGRTDSVTRRSRKREAPSSETAAIASIGASPVSATGANAGARTVITFFASVERTVASAFPA